MKAKKHFHIQQNSISIIISTCAKKLERTKRKWENSTARIVRIVLSRVFLIISIVKNEWINGVYREKYYIIRPISHYVFIILSTPIHSNRKKRKTKAAATAESPLRKHFLHISLYFLLFHYCSPFHEFSEWEMKIVFRFRFRPFLVSFCLNHPFQLNTTIPHKISQSFEAIYYREMASGHFQYIDKLKRNREKSGQYEKIYRDTYMCSVLSFSLQLHAFSQFSSSPSLLASKYMYITIFFAGPRTKSEDEKQFSFGLPRKITNTDNKTSHAFNTNTFMPHKKNKILTIWWKWKFTTTKNICFLKKIILEIYFKIDVNSFKIAFQFWMNGEKF